MNKGNTQPSPGLINPGTEYEQKRYAENGVCHITADYINFRNKPIVSNSNPITGQYYKGEKVKYDLVVITNLYVWISWVSDSTGERRYMTITDKTTKEKWAYCV